MTRWMGKVGKGRPVVVRAMPWHSKMLECVFLDGDHSERVDAVGVYACEAELYLQGFPRVPRRWLEGRPTSILGERLKKASDLDSNFLPSVEAAFYGTRSKTKGFQGGTPIMKYPLPINALEQREVVEVIRQYNKGEVEV